MWIPGPVSHFLFKLNDGFRSTVNKMGSKSSFHSTRFLILQVNWHAPFFTEGKKKNEALK